MIALKYKFEEELQLIAQLEENLQTDKEMYKTDIPDRQKTIIRLLAVDLNSQQPRAKNTLH